MNNIITLYNLIISIPQFKDTLNNYYLCAFSHQVIIDPLALGDVAKRRRIYILVIHRKILRKDIDNNATLERVLKEMVERLKVDVPAPNPYLGEKNIIF